MTDDEAKEIVRAFWAGEKPDNWPEAVPFPTNPAPKR